LCRHPKSVVQCVVSQNVIVNRHSFPLLRTLFLSPKTAGCASLCLGRIPGALILNVGRLNASTYRFKRWRFVGLAFQLSAFLKTSTLDKNGRCLGCISNGVLCVFRLIASASFRVYRVFLSTR
jgi:hypothetical protein